MESFNKHFLSNCFMDYVWHWEDAGMSEAPAQAKSLLMRRVVWIKLLESLEVNCSWRNQRLPREGDI